MRETGQTTPESGWYRCAICGAEIYMEAGDSFPFCARQDHAPRWLLTESCELTMTSGKG